MCLWNELRVYLRNYSRIQIRWHRFFTKNVLCMMLIFVAFIIWFEYIISLCSVTFSVTTNAIIRKILRGILVCTFCLWLYQLWIEKKNVLFPNQRLPNLLQRHLPGVGWLYSPLHTQVITLPNQDPVPPRLSEPGFQAPTTPPEYQPPLLDENLVRRAIHQRTRPTTRPTSLFLSSKHEKHSPLRTITTHRQTPDHSQRLQMPSFPNIIQALLAKKPRHTTAVAEEPWQTNVPRNTDVSVEVHMPDAPGENRQVPNILITDYPVNYGASTSRAADYMEFVARQPPQPTYKKKRSSECRQSDDNSDTSDENRQVPNILITDTSDENRQVPNILITDYPVNYGASTSRAADYMEFATRQPTQPTYKKKRSSECRQSDDNSDTSENMDLDKTPEKVGGHASDRSSPGLSGSGSSNKSSPRRSDGSPARSSSPEKSADLETQQSVAATNVSSGLCEYLGSRTKGTQTDSSGSERPVLEMSERLRSKLIADASTAETSFSHTGIKEKPKSILASTSLIPDEKKSIKSKNLLSSPSTLNIPLVHRSPSGKRKKETSSEDEDAASAQNKKRSPSKKPRQKVPKIEENDESNSSEADQ